MRTKKTAGIRRLLAFDKVLLRHHPNDLGRPDKKFLTVLLYHDMIRFHICQNTPVASANRLYHHTSADNRSKRQIHIGIDAEKRLRHRDRSASRKGARLKSAVAVAVAPLPCPSADRSEVSLRERRETSASGLRTRRKSRLSWPAVG